MSEHLRCRSDFSRARALRSGDLGVWAGLDQPDARRLAGPHAIPNDRRGGGLGHIAFSWARANVGPVPDCPSCSLRSEPAAGRFKAASRRGAADPASLREGRLASPSRSRPYWSANLPCLISRIGPVKPSVLCRFLIVRIEGQTGTGRNRFGSQGRNRHGQAHHPKPLQCQTVATP